MPRIAAFFAVLLMTVLVACSAPAAPPDPYALTSNVLTTPWERVQINVSVSLEGSEASVNIPPEAIELVVDREAGKGLFKLSLTDDMLGLEGEEADQLAIIGGRLDLEVLFDGEALYARSPLAAMFGRLLLSQFGEVPEGDYSGWLRLGTKADFDALEELMTAFAGDELPADAPDFSDWADLDPAELQQRLESSGITLTHVESAIHNGVAAEHVTVTVDFAELADSPLFEDADASHFEDMVSADVNLTADIWIDKASGRPVEVSVNGTSSDPELSAFGVVLTFTEPDPSITFDTPETFVDVPLSEMLSEFDPDDLEP